MLDVLCFFIGPSFNAPIMELDNFSYVFRFKFKFIDAERLLAACFATSISEIGSLL